MDGKFSQKIRRKNFYEKKIRRKKILQKKIRRKKFLQKKKNSTGKKIYKKKNPPENII